MAFLDGEGYQFLDDPGPALTGLRRLPAGRLSRAIPRVNPHEYPGCQTFGF